MLRDFQTDLKGGIYQGWNEGARNIMAVAPTGSGKTVIMGAITAEMAVPTCSIAHRQELVAQISLAFNREGVPHGIIAPAGVVREIIAAQMEVHGRSFYNPQAPVRVAGVDTLANYDATDRWLRQVQLVIQDEGHHVLRDNKWGRAMGMFPAARGLFFTAHAVRADGAGLGRHADGLVDKLVIGPSCRNLINRGFLTDYTVFCPPSDVDMDGVDVTDSGELNMKKTRERVHASKTIVGDVVHHYKRNAEGELGITFAVDVVAAQQIAERFNIEGIPAAVVTAKTPIGERARIMRKFRDRQLIQLVNVDVLGEGTDVPACTVVSMARPTASFQLCAQQFGRMLRILVSDDDNRDWHAYTDEQRLARIASSNKPRGILFDHVGNIAHTNKPGVHGLPDRPRIYSLDRRERRAPKDDAIPLRVCINPECFQPYEAVLSVCPHCGMQKPPPALRSLPEHVDGDLFELDPAVLAEMRGEIDRIDNAPTYPKNASAAACAAIKRNHWERQQWQGALRKAMALWAGWQTHQGRDDREAQRRFFFAFGIDVASAQALNAKDAAELDGRVRAQLTANNIVSTEN